MRTRFSLCLASLSALLALTGCPDDTTSSGGTTSGTAGDDDGGTTVAPPPVTDTGDETGTPSAGDPPPTPEIISPSDGEIDVGTPGADGVTVQAELCWTEVEDPEGNRVRYRVFLDDIELTEGKLAEEPGFESPCLTLNFNPGQAYVWTVQAFEADFLDADGNPTSQSGQADPASFTTIDFGSAVVFEDDFEDEEKGWTVGGDANGGDWVHGTPEETTTEAAMSQPGVCAEGSGCWFTGHNPDGANNIADVRGGTTTLTSPPFDLSGFATASVRIDRFFYKQIFPETGTLFRVELVVPDPESPTGEEVFVLEQLESQKQADGANDWVPTEYAACGVPMVADSRLRIVATDLGEGILEAAIDNVEVEAYGGTKICDGGEGALCNPALESSCADGYLCCNQGVVNNNIYRCATPVPALSYPDGGQGEMGCDGPDLFPTELGMSWEEDDIFVADNSCLLYEECVGGTGSRHLLRFDTITPNMGSRDLTMGVPTNHPDLFHFSACHGHYHFDGYAVYDLLDGDGNVIAEGHKQAFCLLDWNSWTGMAGSNYSCSNQGISKGWQDVYGGYLDCNWIDITDVPNGAYTLRISVNPALAETGKPPIIERDYDNNVLEVPVTITGN